MFDWNYYKRGVPVKELKRDIEVVLPKVSSNLPAEVKKSLKEILLGGRKNGISTKNCYTSGAHGLSIFLRVTYKDEINSRIRSFNLDKTHAELFCDIALMTFRRGYENPDEKNPPEFYQKILSMLE